MASFPEGPVLEIYHGHKREQSQDSGAYIDWNSEDSASPTGNLDGIAKGDFVTVVAVESGIAGEESEEVSPFVTVLEINDEDGKVKGKSTNANEDVEEEVLVYRLPGERLGFGLKFEGGTNTAENVKRLFIQSSAPDSPASRAECSWGALAEGDEIIRIDGHQVRDMTRLDCVRCLKESSVVIKLLVRHPGQVVKPSEKGSQQSSTSPLVISAEMKKVPPPPPIPPRKVPRKISQKDDTPTVSPPEGFCDVQQVPVPKVRNLTLSEDASPSKNQSKSSIFVPAKEMKQEPEVKRITKRNVFDLKHIPPEPEVYLDILAQEDAKNNCESESDDTGSTISTVMGFSMSTATNSSFDLRSNTSSYCDSTTPSTPTSTPSTPILDVAKVMIPQQNTDNNDFLFIKMINDKSQESVNYDEKASVCSDDNTPLQPPLSFQDAPLSYGNEEIKVSLMEVVENGKNSSEENLDDSEQTGKISAKPVTGKKTSLIPRLAKSIGLITSPPKPSPRKDTNVEKRSSKKRPPPPPPPPRTDRPRCPQPETEQKSVKSSIPYLKKKKAPKLEKTSKETSTGMEKSEGTSPEESETVTEQENQTQILSWPVPELKNIRNQNETDVDGANNADKAEEGEAFTSESDFTLDASGRDSYFLFQWGSSKHLETIGEDEEDGNEDTSQGQNEEEPEEDGKDADAEICPSMENPVAETEEAADDKAEEKETPPGEATSETTPSQDGSVIQEAGVKTKADKEEKEPCNGVTNPICEKLANDVKTDIKPSNGGERGRGKRGHRSRRGGRRDEREGGGRSVPGRGSRRSETEFARVTGPEDRGGGGGMKENMVPIVTAAVGLAPPPTFSRLPPDGHEFPQNYQEGSLPVPGKLRNELYEEELKELPPLPTSEPPVPQKYSFRLDGNLEILPSKKPLPGDFLEDSTQPRPSRASFWRHDERSEKSVRDKIAMFSSVPDPPVSPANSFAGKLSKYKSSDDVFYDDDADCVGNLPNGKPFSRSVVSIDKIGGLNNQTRGYAKKCAYDTPRILDYTNRAQSSMDLTSSSSSAYSSSCSPDSSLSSTTSSYMGYSSTLPRKSSRNDVKSEAGKAPGITRTTSFSLHGRSQSLLDVNPSPYKSRLRPDGAMDDEQKQSSLNILIEQRRKNLSKLRGLVIPEKLPDTPPNQPIFDLPEIKSRDLILTSKLPFKEERSTSHMKWESPVSQTSVRVSDLASPPWKLQNKSPNVPKYSPAFKRKAISVYGTSPVKKDPPKEKLQPPAKPPRNLHAYDGKNGFTATDIYHGRKTQGRYRNSEEDSDNDSAVSSSRSSISHGFSPPSSPLLDPQHGEEIQRQLLGEKSPLTRTLSSETNASNTSTLTSGSQASCSSNGGSSSDCNSKRILKAQSVEAINRKNVLTSAKYSRGFDAKSGSPLIQRKFPTETTYDEKDSFESKYVPVKNETVNYKLATEIGTSNPVEVKIAFMNDVDEVCMEKKKVAKTESSPCPISAVSAKGRRTSMPEEGWTGKIPDNGHLPLTEKPSTESVRSRASSVDTIIENVLISENGLASPRVKTNTDITRSDVLDRNDLYNKIRSSVEKEKNGSMKEGISGRNQRSVSVHDIRKAFEKVDTVSNGRSGKIAPLSAVHLNGNHVRVSSLDSTNSEDSCAFGPGQYGSSSNLHREQFGSITSLASSTSLISPQELQLLIDEANQTLEESGGCSGGSSAASHDVLVVILHRDTAGGSVGITLAGGADYESKEITVHKVLTGSPADRDGRIQKGDRILSINGKSMKGITHRESLAILKSPRPEVVLVVSRPKIDANCEVATTEENGVATSVRANLSNRPPRILEGTTLSDSGESTNEEIARGPPVTFMLVKDGAGLGFSLEGGKDSPLGDKPLIIKKIFTGGAAEKCGHLKAGDEILNVNGMDVTLMSRIEAWKLMKRIPDGNVSITVRRQVENRSVAEGDR